MSLAQKLFYKVFYSFGILLFGFSMAFQIQAEAQMKSQNEIQVKKSSAKNSNELKLITVKQYSALNDSQRKKYIDEVRKAWMEFEIKYNGNLKGDYSFIKLLLPQSYAQGEPTQCIIGGRIFNVIRSGSKPLCPTKESSCKTANGNQDGFQCGKIFGNSCISRLEIKDMSKRCYEVSKKDPLTPTEYGEFLTEAVNMYKDLCAHGDRGPTNDGCHYLLQRMNDLYAGYEKLTNSANLGTGATDLPEIVLSNPPVEAVAKEEDRGREICSTDADYGANIRGQGLSGRTGEKVRGPFTLYEKDGGFDLYQGNTKVNTQPLVTARRPNLFYYNKGAPLVDETLSSVSITANKKGQCKIVFTEKRSLRNLRDRSRSSRGIQSEVPEK